MNYNKITDRPRLRTIIQEMENCENAGRVDRALLLLLNDSFSSLPEYETPAQFGVWFAQQTEDDYKGNVNIAIGSLLFVSDEFWKAAENL